MHIPSQRVLTNRPSQNSKPNNNKKISTWRWWIDVWGEFRFGLSWNRNLISQITTVYSDERKFKRKILKPYAYGIFFLWSWLLMGRMEENIACSFCNLKHWFIPKTVFSFFPLTIGEINSPFPAFSKENPNLFQGWINQCFKLQKPDRWI